jgi:filamentous hemagglutinin family protein
MKTRPKIIARRSRAAPRFALHPLSFAICMAMSGAALALPQGGKVVVGNATIGTPSQNTEVIKQTSDKAIIDWQSFSIASGEKVRFYQPSSTSVTLNRVVGYDPTNILGQMSSNGKIFLLNPYGVVFGAGARIDVGGMVASTLSMANSDFLASRYSLTSIDPSAPAQRGEVRNDGTISSPGGLVVLAGPSVTNTGTITAPGGRVGMAAVNSVSIDVEGDGLIFFQADATEAKNRLQQLGRIQADGGTVEMRAEARGAFADTVLNMAGVVQARSLGSRNGQVVIDGGSEGSTVVSGQIDVSGRAGSERGGTAIVEGQQLALADTARIDASGDLGGGTIRVGGGFHGTDSSIRNADTTSVAAGAQLNADALTNGDGGTVVVWSDHGTTYQGTTSARGGNSGGDGGSVEVSGHDSLSYQGLVDTRAPQGKTGTLLLDPTDITISASPDTGTMLPSGGNPNTFSDVTAQNSNLNTTTLQTALGTASVIVDTTSGLGGFGNITVQSPILDWAAANSLTLKADAAITVNAGSTITNTGTGGLNLFANGAIALNAAVSLAGGNFVVANKAGSGRAPSFTAGAAGTISTAGGANVAGGLVDIETIGVISTQGITTSGGTSAGAGKAAGSVTLNSSTGAITTNGAINALGGAAAGTNQAGGAGGAVALTANGLVTVGASIATTGGAPTGAGAKGLGGTIAMQGNGVTIGTGLSVNADDNTITVNGGGGAIQLNNSTLTTTSNAAGAVTVRNATTANLGNLATGATGTTTLGVAADISGAVTQTAATAINTGTLTASTAGAITLDKNNTITDLGAITRGGAFTLNDTTGGLTLTGSVGSNASAVSITTAGGVLSLGANNITATTAAGNVTLAGVGVTQGAGSITAGGTASVNGGTGSIALQSATNNFTGAVTLNTTGANAAIQSSGALTLAAPTLGTNTGLTAIAGTTLTLPAGDISTGTGSIDLEAKGGALTTPGTLTTTTGSITLLGSAGLTVANGLTTASGPISLTGGGAGGLAVNTGVIVDAGNNTINADGGGTAIQLNDSTLTTTSNAAGAITVRHATTTNLGNLTTGTTGTTTLGVAADITGAVTQTAATAINTGTLTASTAGAITLDKNNVIADLGAVTRGGAFTLNDTSGLTLTGSVSGGTTTNAVSLTTTGILDLGANNITATSGAGNVALVGVGVTQGAGSITAGGTTSVNGGTGSIALQSATNNLTGAVTLNTTGSSAAIQSTGALTLAAPTLGANTGLTAIAGTTLTLPAGAISTGSGNIDLEANGGTLTTPGSLGTTSGSITLIGSAGLTISNGLTTTSGPISLTGGGAGGLAVSAGLNVDAGNSTIIASGGGGAIQLNNSRLTTTSNAAGAITVRNATTANLGILATGATGTTTLGVAADITGAVTQTAATGINTGTLTASTAGTITLDKNNTITDLGAVTRGGAFTLDDTGGLTLTGSVSGGTTTNAVSLTTTGLLDLGTNNITATTGAGIVTLSGAGVTQGAGSITAGGTTSVNGGTGSIALQSATNNLTGAVTLNTTGTNQSAAIQSSGALTLAAPTLGANTSLTAIAGTALTLPAGPINTGTGNLDLRSLGGTLSTPGNLTAANISLTGSAGLTLANNLSAANVSLNTTNSAIAESPGAIITATGATTFNAGSGTVTLGQQNVLSSIGGTGGAVSITEHSADGVALDTINATSLSVDTSALGGAVSQTPGQTLTVTGATTINAGAAGTITLANPGNNFGSFGATGGAVSVSDINAIVLNSIAAASLAVDTSAGNGAVTQSAALNVSGATAVNAGSGAITLTAAGNALGSFGATGGAVSLTEGSAGGIALDNVNATSLTVDTHAAPNGNVSQTALKTLTITGATAVNAGTGSVVLANSGNNFGSIGVTGGAVSITDINALALDATNATTLTVNTSAGNGAVTQNAPVVVTGTTVVNAGTGAITLANAGNDFSSTLGDNSFSGGAITLHDTNALTVTTLANGANQAVNVSAGGALTLPGVVTTTADITLSSGATLTTPTLSGNNISLTGTTGVTLANNVNAASNLNLSTTGSPVNQSSGKIVAGGITTVTAGVGAVTLAQPLDDFNSINVVSGGAVSINDANALTAAALASGTLSVTSTGVLTSGGALSGTNVALAGNGGINLANNVTATGTLQLTSSNNAITQTAGAISATAGLTTVNAGTGDVTLAQVGNDFSNASGISVTGGAKRITDANNLLIAGLSAAPNKDLSLVAVTGSITGVSGNIDTGSADLTISAGAGFTTFGTLRGTNVTLGGGTGGLSIGNNVTALNNLTLNATNSAITQTGGSISAAGTATANAGTGAITLALAGNDFATFAGNGSAINLRDDNGLALGAINTNTLTLNTSAGNGAVTQSGAAVVSGATTISAGSGAVTLSNAGNNFANIGVSGGAVAITDINAVALNAINAASLAVNTSAGNGAVTQNGAAIVSGATAVNAGSGAITLSNAGNNFGSVGATGGAVSITDTNALALDAINATSLTIAAGGAVTQNAAAVVSGATAVNAGANAITLTNAGNNFSSVGATGSAVAITDINALALDAVTATSLSLDTSAGNGAITQNAAAIVSGATAVNAGTGAVALTNAGNNFGNVAVTGGAVSVTDINALALGAINAASLSVNTSAGNGAVTQTGPAVVSGATTVNAGTGSVALTNTGNDFAGLGISGGTINVVDSNALTLTSLTSAPNQAVTVSAGGVLTLPATAIDTGSAPLSLSSGGALTSVGTLRGTNVSLTSNGAMTLASNLTSLGTLSLVSGNAPITQTTGTIVAAGPATINAGSGNITLAQPSNDFQSGIALTGGAVSVHDLNDLTVTSLGSGANQPVSLVAGGSLVLPSTPIATGTADLILQALGGSLVINSALSGNNVTLTGSAGLAIGADVTTSGDQIYTTPVQIAGNVTLNSGASHIDLQGGANGGGNNLSLVSSNAGANAIHTGAPITNTAQFTITGNSTLGGNVTTTGNQTYAGPVVLGADVTLAAGAAKIDLQGAVDAGGHNLALTSSNAAADAIDTAAPIANAAQLTVTGKSTFASGVATTGAQLYTDTVTLGSNASFSGSSLGFGNGIVAGSFDLGLQADTLNLAGAVTGSGNATLSSQTQSASVGIAGGAGTLQVSQAELNAFSSFASLTVGRADGTGNITSGNLVLPANLSVQSASGDIAFTGTVGSAAGQSRNLSVSTGGTSAFGGAVGGAIGGSAALGNLSVAGTSILNASVTTTGSQTFGGNVAIGADATLSSSAENFAASLDVGTHAVTVFTDTLGIAGSATGGGAASIRIAPKDATGSIGVAGAAGDLQVSQALVNTLAGVPTLTLGRNDSTGAVAVGSLVLPADLAISNGSGSVAFNGSVDSAAGPARNLSVSTTGTTSIAGAIGSTQPINALTIAGASQLGSNVTTSGAQTYSGPATLVADSTLTGSNVAFASTVDGGHALTVNAASTVFGGAVGSTVALTSLTTDGAGTTQLGGNVTTTAAQTYNDALSLNANAVLAGTTLNLAGSIDGAQTLTLNGSTGVTLAQAIGATTPLAGLSVTGPLQLDAGTVNTTGAQTYAGPTTLGAATALTASSIGFGNTLDGAFALTLQSAGTNSFAGAVGAATPLASLAASGGGAVQLGAPSVQTSGSQSYSGALQLAGNTSLTGSSLNLGGPVSGAADLTLQTNALSGGTSIAGSGTLTIAPVDPSLSIGVAGGAGSLQVAQAVLDGASGFSAHVIGRADGSGTISTGNLLLRADTTLQTSSGDIDIGGSVDGAFALTLNSGGTTRITGPIGVITPLKSLTTDNNAGAADWNGTTGERTTFDTADGTGSARVVTTGAQTYNDPLTASVPLVLTGGAITATQASNSFAGTVSASADSLQLHSSTDLLLGTVTLANGGAVDTDGVLHLTGALTLNGGTLVLTANATPTAVDLTDPALQGKPFNYGFVPIKEASATVVEDTGATLISSAGSLLAIRSPNGGTLQLDQPGNALLGNISAVSGKLDDNDLSRFTNASTLTLGFIRIASSEIHVAGAPPSDGDQTVLAAGLEGDVIKLTANVLTTGTDGLIRARLPFNNVQGAQSSIPGVTFVMTPTALATGGGFGTSAADTAIRIQVGGPEGGFVTADPKGVGGDNAVIFLGGNADIRPFYDENGKLTEIRIFYNGDAPRTPQEAGALAAVIALIEEARHARFEEAVRTENVSARLRSGVIAEVGAGRPATVGRESIRLPETCDVKPGTLLCE